MTEEEQTLLAQGAAWSAEEGAYAALQGTKPQTLAFSLTDSPVGLAAWISEKFQTWSDCDGDLETAVPMDVLLRDISLYWFGQTIDASLRLYEENRANPLVFAPGERIRPPFGMALFPKELPTPPRSWVERVFEVRQWNTMPRGGHFAALEQPELLANEIHGFFRPLRRQSPPMSCQPAWPCPARIRERSQRPRNLRSPMKPSGVSRNSMQTRRKRGDRHRTGVSGSVRRKRHQSITSEKADCTANCRRSPADRRWPWIRHGPTRMKRLRPERSFNK